MTSNLKKITGKAEENGQSREENTETGQYNHVERFVTVRIVISCS